MPDSARTHVAGHSSRRGAIATIGTFDGVHRGHAGLLSRVVRTAAELDGPAAAVTFDPHPAAVLRPETVPMLLTPGSERIEALACTGIEYLLIVPFDARLAGYDPARFVDEILVGRIGIKHLIVGHDHAIGRDRRGDAATLVRLGRERGFGVEVVEPIVHDGEVVSSSRIRRALERGEVRSAARALGRDYSVRGTVIAGEGRGRKLGFPTANVGQVSARKLVPGAGVYAGRAVVAGRTLEGALHIGPRPTFGESASTIEFFAFDFDDDIYGEAIEVRFIARVRDIEDFSSVGALIAAMNDDCARARELLAQAG